MTTVGNNVSEFEKVGAKVNCCVFVGSKVGRSAEEIGDGMSVGKSKEEGMTAVGRKIGTDVPVNNRVGR